jgi:pimeloyl-ACP methyl ester carboxylesterase
MEMKRRELRINGTRVVLYEGGEGRPLVFLHGGGTGDALASARPFAASHRVIVPYHPGWGESDDDPRLDTLHDFVLHYLDLFDTLRLAQFDLMGFSVGGGLAAKIAIEHSHRLRRLVLGAPTGLVVPEYPCPDWFAIPPAEMPRYLVHDPSILAPPAGAPPPNAEFLALRAREGAAAKHLSHGRQTDPALGHWLHRISVPTLLAWGREDRLVPFGQAAAWAKLIPEARIEAFDRAGHLVMLEAPQAAARIAEFLR